MKDIFNVFWRELKIFFKDKRSFAILLFVPILYTLIFGYFYQDHIVKHAKTAVINHSPSSISRMIVNSFEKSERFDLKYYLNDESEIKDLMERDKIDVAIVIPEDFTKNVKTGKNTQVLVGVDTTNIIIGNGSIGAASQIVQTVSKGIMVKKYSAKGLLNDEAYNSSVSLSYSFHPWYNPGYNYTNFILLGILAVALQQITLMFCANSFTREIEEDRISELSQKNILSIFIGKFMFFLICGIFTLLGGAFIAIGLYHVPLRGNFMYILMLALPFFIAVIALGFFVSVFCKDQGESTQITMLFAYPSFLLSGVTWPLFSMPDSLRILAKCLPLTYYADNVRKVSLMGVDFSVLRNDTYTLWIVALIYLVISFSAVAIKYRASKSSQTSCSLGGKEVEKC